jgi:N-acetyl-1-D-myo-inositol-2-amino-2-deoxy-alpha-D-glucopyranoside deacetylase
VTTAIDVRQYLPTKLAALACHRSQLPPDHFLRRMPPELTQQLWAYEYFSLERDRTGGRPGEGLEGDLFAGLD